MSTPKLVKKEKGGVIKEINDKLAASRKKGDPDITLVDIADEPVMVNGELPGMETPKIPELIRAGKRSIEGGSKGIGDAMSADYDDDIEIGDKNCPKCGGQSRSRECRNCDEGFSEKDHDCGEDSCCCLNPEPGRCSECMGKGWFNWCPTCGWDLIEKKYINGRDERTPGMQAARIADEVL